MGLVIELVDDQGRDKTPGRWRDAKTAGVKSSSRPGLQNVLLKLDSSVGKLAECSSLLELSGLLGVLKTR
jgi:hypothetical protein